MTPPVAGLSPRVSTRIVGPVNLHDWIDELCDALDLDAEVDEALVLDLARVAAHNVVRPAAPVSTFLLGLAAGRQGAGPEELEELAGRARALAEAWDRPAGATAAEEEDVEVPDDSAVDHSGDARELEDA